MKKKISFLLAFIMATSIMLGTGFTMPVFASEVDYTDKISNPDFELGNVGSVPTGWTRTSGTYVVKSVGGYSGSYMVRNSNTSTPGAASQNSGTSDAYLTQTVTGLPNGLYRLSAKYFSSGTLPVNTTNWPYLSVNNYQATGSVEIRQSYGVSNDWSEKEMFVNVTNGNLLIRIGFGYSLTALMFSCWDDVQLNWVSEPLPEGNIRSFTAPAAVSTALNTAPVLPENVNATFVNSTGGTNTSLVPVIWDPIPESKYQVPGIFSATGRLANSGLIVSCNVNVEFAARNYDIAILGPNKVNSGANFDVNLGLIRNTNALNGLKVYAADLTVEYDAEYLSFVSAFDKDGRVFHCSESPVGTIRIIGISQAGIESSQALFGLTFKAKKVFEMPLNERVSVKNAQLGYAIDTSGAISFTAENLLKSTNSISVTDSIYDVNKDGFIDVADLACVIYYYGGAKQDADWQEKLTADVDLDGAIGLEDLALVAKNLYASGLFQVDKEDRINVAYNRMAFNSSSSFYGAALSGTSAIYYNYAETAQLVTDGITDNSQLYNRPVITGKFNNDDKDYGPARAFETSPETKYRFKAGTNQDGTPDYGWITYKFPNGEKYACVAVFMQASDNNTLMPNAWVYEGSNDNGQTWTQCGQSLNMSFTAYTGNTSKRGFTYTHTVPYEMYRIRFTGVLASNTAKVIEIGNIELGTDSTIVASSTTTIPFKSKTDTFTSRWTSGKSDPQWVYVDLGKNCTIDGFNLYWDICYAKEYSISVSNDAKTWTDVFLTTNGRGGIDGGTFAPVSARYVKMTGFKRSDDKMGYQLKEFEIYGKDPVVITPKPQPLPLADGTQYLTSGAWKIQRASFVDGDGIAVSSPGFDDRSWNVATVPGTVLMSYVNNGAVPNPNVANYIEYSSDTFFTADFWYRDTFKIPASQAGKKTWLNFDGINWKAIIYLNGKEIGRIESAFIRGKFDITEVANYGGENYLAVKIIKNDTTGNAKQRTLLNAGGNGGNLGNDSPSFHASIGWDWGGTARGRNNGIYEDVYVSYSGDAILVDPFITTDVALPSLDTGYVNISTDIKNTSNQAQNVSVRAVLNPGNIEYVETVGSVAANSSTNVSLSPIIVNNPKLWWPNGYGDPFLYDLELTLLIGGKVSDTKNINVGIRKITYDVGAAPTDGVIVTGAANKLWLYCNGKRIALWGGNWGMSDINLALDAKGYDDRVRLHKNMNFTMIRNWVGMVENDAFYDACDKYGILIDDDFWLANPSDGSNPKNNDLFMAAANDKIKRIRSHPSLAIYCGRNEGVPPAALNTALQNACVSLDGTRIYVEASNARAMSGNGPYGVQDPKQYFNPNAAISANKLHTEEGQMNIPTYESLVEMYTEDYLWPINDVWGMHDFTQSHGYAFAFQSRVSLYGTPTTIKDFERKAQMVGYESHKAMYEGSAVRDGAGLLMWMSNPAWPSTVWQTYDHYLDINGGFAGVKKASQRLNIILNLANTYNEKVFVVNKTLNDYSGANSLSYEVKVYNLDGTEKYSYADNVSAAIDSINDTGLTVPFSTIADLSDVHFVVLKLKNQAGEVLSDNYYWRSNKVVNSGATITYSDYSQLNTMPYAEFNGSATKQIIGDKTKLTATINNTNSKTAVMVRFKVMQKGTDKRVLPVFYDDEYFLVLPGQSKTVAMDYTTADAFGNEPQLFVEGFNVNKTEIPIIQ